MVDDLVAGNQQDQGSNDTDDTCQCAGDECFGIEDFGDVVLACTKCS